MQYLFCVRLPWNIYSKSEHNSCKLILFAAKGAHALWLSACIQGINLIPFAIKVDFVFQSA